MEALMSRLVRVTGIVVLLLPLSGCLFHSHRVEQRISTAHLQEATKEQLIQFIDNQASQIKTLNATVTISPAVGGSKKGQVTEYTDVKGYVLVRKPGMLRMIALVPVLGNRMFDMVSNGTNFWLSIPPKNKFIVGRNDVIHPEHSSLENLRPQAILDALLLREIDPQSEIAVLENATEPVLDAKSKKPVEEPDYTIDVISKSDGDWILSRKIIFNREDLLPHRQIVYDKNGDVATDARYENYQDLGGVNFPTKITINRPQEEYDIILEVVKARFNEPISDEQFKLEQPPGSQLVRLDLPESERMEIPQPRQKKSKPPQSYGPDGHSDDPPSSAPDQKQENTP
jgi:outer membrane lipoprotein-sorting protein